jgi:hypothetical protein
MYCTQVAFAVVRRLSLNFGVFPLCPGTQYQVEKVFAEGIRELALKAFSGRFVPPPPMGGNPCGCAFATVFPCQKSVHRDAPGQTLSAPAVLAPVPIPAGRAPDGAGLLLLEQRDDLRKTFVEAVSSELLAKKHVTKWKTGWTICDECLPPCHGWCGWEPSMIAPTSFAAIGAALTCDDMVLLVRSKLNLQEPAAEAGDHEPVVVMDSVAASSSVAAYMYTVPVAARDRDFVSDLMVSPGTQDAKNSNTIDIASSISVDPRARARAPARVILARHQSQAQGQRAQATAVSPAAIAIAVDDDRGPRPKLPSRGWAVAAGEADAPGGPQQPAHAVHVVRVSVVAAENKDELQQELPGARVRVGEADD